MNVTQDSADVNMSKHRSYLIVLLTGLDSCQKPDVIPRSTNMNETASAAAMSSVSSLDDIKLESEEDVDSRCLSMASFSLLHLINLTK